MKKKITISFKIGDAKEIQTARKELISSYKLFTSKRLEDKGIKEYGRRLKYINIILKRYLKSYYISIEHVRHDELQDLLFAGLIRLERHTIYGATGDYKPSNFHRLDLDNFMMDNSITTTRKSHDDHWAVLPYINYVRNKYSMGNFMQ